MNAGTVLPADDDVDLIEINRVTPEDLVSTVRTLSGAWAFSWSSFDRPRSKGRW